MGIFKDIFDGFSDLMTSISDAISQSRQEETKNETRPSVTELTFTPMNPKLADELEARKPKNYTAPEIQKFLDCIRQGKAEYVELLGISSYDYDVEYSLYGEMNAAAPRYHTQTYIKLADMNGVVFKEAVSALVNKTKIGKIESETTESSGSFEVQEETNAPGVPEATNTPDGSDAPEAAEPSEAEEAPATQVQNPDPVDPKLYPHVILLHYFLGETEYYRVLTKEQCADLIPAMIYVKTRYKCFYTGGNHEW